MARNPRPKSPNPSPPSLTGLGLLLFRRQLDLPVEVEADQLVDDLAGRDEVVLEGSNDTTLTSYESGTGRRSQRSATLRRALLLASSLRSSLSPMQLHIAITAGAWKQHASFDGWWNWLLERA